MHTNPARDTRLRRMYRHGERLLVAPLDHAIAMGPVVPRGQTLSGLAAAIVDGGADALVLHKGAVRQIDPAVLARTCLVIHLNASTGQASDPDAKVLVADVAEAVSLGADAVSVQVNIGSATEARQIQDLAEVARDCDRWNVPLLAMMYARGPRVENPRDPALVEHAVTVATELGADLVKTTMVTDLAAMHRITQRCPVPLLVAGGAARVDEGAVLADIRGALLAGAGGVALGRCLFQSRDPHTLTTQVSDLVHGSHHATPSSERHGHSHGIAQTLLA